MDQPKAPQSDNKKLTAQFTQAPGLGVKPALNVATDQLSRARLARDVALIAAAMMARGLDIPDDIAGFGIERSVDPTALPGSPLGQRDNGRRIGGVPSGQSGDKGGDNGLGFDDPLAGQHNHPGGRLVGPPSMPGKDDLTGQDTDYGNGSDSSHGSVWSERHTERSSSDGSQTWGSTSYRDYSGNHWRVDYHDERHDDGRISSKETVFDGAGEPIKTTVREGQVDGTATETTTTHETGETQTRQGTLPEIFPDRSQTGEEGGGGDPIAPRGWSNPITGTVQNPGLATGNNQVNPGREASDSPAGTPLRIDPQILVVNPAPDQFSGAAVPRDIRHDPPTIIDPPRP